MDGSDTFNVTLIIIAGLVAAGLVLWIGFNMIAPIVDCYEAQGLYTKSLLSGHCDLPK